MKEIILIYMPLITTIMMVFFGVLTYFHHKYKIDDENVINKFKLAQDHLFIKLKLFKYDNNFNLLFLIPYLIAWSLFFAVLIVYIFYWCGALALATLLTNKWVNLFLIVLLLLYMGYGAIMDQVILHGGRLEKPTFVIEQEKGDKPNVSRQSKE